MKKKTTPACLLLPLLPMLFAASSLAQEQRPALEAPVHNLPVQKIGPNDLLLITVTDAPELTRTFRVSPDGSLSLPLVKRTIPASGRLPGELETAIAELLVTSDLLVEPIVKVTVAEYHSRPISVAGAVRKPVTFQAIGGVTLLEALTRAEGLSDLAGGEILVSRAGEPLPVRIPVRRLIDAADATLNLKLEGGEEVRVPEAVRIYIAGNVRKPGAVPVREGDQITVLKMIAIAEGLTAYASKQAYVYRSAASGEPGAKSEVTIELDKIMKRQAPDVALQPNDVFYVPDNTRRRTQMTVLDRITLFGSTAGATALIWRGR